MWGNVRQKLQNLDIRDYICCIVLYKHMKSSDVQYSYYTAQNPLAVIPSILDICFCGFMMW